MQIVHQEHQWVEEVSRLRGMAESDRLQLPEGVVRQALHEWLCAEQPVTLMHEYELA